MGFELNTQIQYCTKEELYNYIPIYKKNGKVFVQYSNLVIKRTLRTIVW